MSVLKTIKGALNNVQQVGTSIKSLKKKSSRQKTFPGVEAVDLDAGGDLLNKFHEQWSEMHQQASQNAKAAQKLDSALRTQYNQCEQQAEDMNQLMSLASGLPRLLTDITKLVEKIGTLQTQFQTLEDAMVTLDDAIEKAEMTANKRHHHRQLALYRQRRALELEQYKVTIANEHVKNVEGYEAKLQEHLRVKQEAFEETFAREMQIYRESGRTAMKPLLTRSVQDVELSDISIDQDNSALDDFLNSDGVSPESSTASITIEEDDDDDDDESYVNIGLVSNHVSDPELEDCQTHNDNTASPQTSSKTAEDCQTHSDNTVSPQTSSKTAEDCQTHSDNTASRHTSSKTAGNCPKPVTEPEEGSSTGQEEDTKQDSPKQDSHDEDEEESWADAKSRSDSGEDGDVDKNS